jgi:catechol 2,3-dioxygenase
MFTGPPTQTLHHYALRLESFDHLKQAADRLAAAGVKVETGPGRHSVGGNVYLFLWTPGGNRLEFSAEMPRVGKGETKVWSELPTAFSAWGATPPPTFAEGS